MGVIKINDDDVSMIEKLDLGGIEPGTSDLQPNELTTAPSRQAKILRYEIPDRQYMKGEFGSQKEQEQECQDDTDGFDEFTCCNYSVWKDAV